MWTSFCSGRRVCLIILAAAMLVSSSEVVAADLGTMSCCPKVSVSRIKEIKACYEQKPRVGCRSHAFRIITKSGRQWCINPDAHWLKIKIKQGDLLCPPEIS